MKSRDISRRRFLAVGTSAAVSLAGAPLLKTSLARAENSAATVPLQEFGYGDISLASELHNHQLEENIAVLMALSDDSLLKPLRKMSGQAAPGEELGGSYLYDPAFEGGSLDVGFAPACTFGQWVSALARAYALHRR